MPWMSRRALAERDAQIDRLRDRCRDLEAEVLEAGRANGRLARTSGDAEASLRIENDRLRKDRDRLLVRVEDLMYTPEQRQLIDKGGPAKEEA